MFSLAFFVSALAVLSGYSLRVSACDHIIGKTFDFPLCLVHKGVLVDGRHVPYGTQDFRIQLEEPSRKALIVCGRHRYILTWSKTNKNGNQIRASYVDGAVRLEVYWCNNFDGPKRAGIRCAVETFSSACPGKVGDNHTCVFKVRTRSFSSDTVRNAVEVSTDVAAELQQELQVSVGVSHIEERVRVKTYTVESQSYIFIPAGYMFCSYSKVQSVSNYHSSTGFSWQCNAPTYFQRTTINLSCTDLTLCPTQAPCSKMSGTTDGAKSTAVPPVPILLLLCVMVDYIVRQKYSE